MGATSIDPNAISWDDIDALDAEVQGGEFATPAGQNPGGEVRFGVVGPSPQDVNWQQLHEMERQLQPKTAYGQDINVTPLTDQLPKSRFPEKEKWPENFWFRFGGMLPTETAAYRNSLAKPPEAMVTAANAGVLWDKGADHGHFLAGLAWNEENQVLAYRQALNPTGMEQIDVRRGPDTGEVEYFSVADGRYARVNPIGVDVSDVKRVSGDLGITLATEILGAVALGAFGPAGILTGAGAGAAAGEIIKLELGYRLGINQDMTGGDMVRAGAAMGALALGAGVASEALMSVSQLVYRMVKGLPIRTKDLAGTEFDMTEALKLQERLNERLTKEELRLGSGQASGDADLLNMQEHFKRSQPFQKAYGDFGDQQAAAVEEFYQIINQPHRGRETPEEVTEAVRGIAESKAQRPVLEAQHSAAKKQGELEANLEALPTTPPETQGAKLRARGAKEVEAFNEETKRLVTELNTVTGNAEFIANTSTHSAIATLDAETETLLLESLKKPTRRLLGRKQTPPTAEEVEAASPIDLSTRTASQAQAAGPADELAEGLTQREIDKVWDPDAKFTFDEAWNTQSKLKARVRIVSKGLSTDDPEVGAYKLLIGALERDMRQGFADAGEPGTQKMFDDFRQFFREGKDRLDRGAVGRLMERQGGTRGRWVVTDEQAFAKLLPPGNVQAAKDIQALIRDDPDAQDGVRAAWAETYRRAVVKEGRVNLDAHNRFMRDHEGQLKIAFPHKQDMELIRKRHGIEKALRNREARITRLEKEAAKTFEGRLTDLRDIGQLVRLALNPNAPDDAAKLVDLLDGARPKLPDGTPGKREAGTSEILRAVRAKAREYIRTRIVGPAVQGKRRLSHRNLDDFLNGRGGAQDSSGFEMGHRANLRELFGNEYVQDLDLLNATIEVVQREGLHPNRSNTSYALKEAVRAWFGWQLTRPGRIVRYLDILSSNKADEVMLEAILDPAKLARLTSLHRKNVRGREAAAILGALGATVLASGPDQESWVGKQYRDLSATAP